MPLPIAHSAAGIASYLLFAKRDLEHSRRRRILLGLVFVALANGSDLDFIPGILIGEPNRFHHGPSHALITTAALGAAVAMLLRRLMPASPRAALYGCCVLAAISHPLLDMLSADTSLPFGAPILWPFSSEYFMSPVSVFSDVARGSEGRLNFLLSMLSLHNARTVLIEVVFVGCLASAWYALEGASGSSRRRAGLVASLLLAGAYCYVRIGLSLAA